MQDQSVSVTLEKPLNSTKKTLAKRKTLEPNGKTKLRMPNFNWLETQTLIANLEEKLGTRVVAYYTSSRSSINQSHPDLFIDHLRKIGKQEKLSLVLVSNGGLSAASLRIATILRDYCKYLQVIVPSHCASAATNLALAADKIIMSPGGFLTAIDSTLNHELNPKDANGKTVGVSVDQVKRVLKFLNEEGKSFGENGASEGAYRTLFKYLHPMALGEIDRYSSGSELIAMKMMKMHKDSFESEEKINAIAKRLVNDYPMHGFPILFDEAKEIGLPVEKTMNGLSDFAWDLVKCYASVTSKTVTNLDPHHYHVEAFPVAVESIGKRTTYHETFNKRFNSITKSWFVEDDNSRWINIKPSKTLKEAFLISPLDVFDGE